MVRTGITKKKIEKFITTYLSFFIVIPACIGGIWQIVELGNIGFSYIRFFSISQIVPDGLLILSFFILPIIAQWIILIWNQMVDTSKFDKRTKQQQSDEEKEIIRKKEIASGNKIFFGFGVIIILVCSICIFLITNIDFSTFYLIISFCTLFIYIINYTLNYIYNLAEEWDKEFYKFYNVFLFFVYISVLFFACKNIHNSFRVPSNLDNMVKIDSILKTKYPHSKSEILYFNDNFFFTRTTDSAKYKKLQQDPLDTISKIHIIEINKLFSE